MKRLKLEEMSIEQKIGMLLCVRPLPKNPEHEDVKFTLELIRNHALGCIQLDAHKPQIIEMVREAADYPLLIINDTEQGFPTSPLPKVPLMALAACNEDKYYEVFAKSIVTEAKKAGYNGTWGPVIDVLHGDGPGRVSRVFSNYPEKVCHCAEIMARVYKRNGYLSCGKHYPYGRTRYALDGHMAPNDSVSTVEELKNFDLVPYKYLMDRGLLPSIMTTHTEFSAIEPGVIGTCSPKVQKIIRDMGFEGVCFTDSFAMMNALQKHGEDKIMGLAVAAGCDIVLPNYRTSPKQSYEYLLQNYRDGMFTEERLNEAVRRVLAAQDFVGSEPEVEDEFTEEDLATFHDIARDCITAVCEEGYEAALDKEEKKRLFVVLTRMGEVEAAETQAEVVLQPWYRPFEIVEKIKKEYPDADIMLLPEYSTGRQNEAVVVASSKVDEVIFVTFCETGAFEGTDGLTRRTEAVINSVAAAGKVGAVVHFGNPFGPKYLLPVPRLILGFSMAESQLLAIDVLKGKIPAKGNLPFKIRYHQTESRD